MHSSRNTFFMENTYILKRTNFFQRKTNNYFQQVIENWTIKWHSARVVLIQEHTSQYFPCQIPQNVKASYI